METAASILCPYCGQSFEVLIDTTISSQRFTIDCEVCCRPLEIAAQSESGEVVSLEVLT